MSDSKQKSATEILTDLTNEVFDIDAVPSSSEAREILEEAQVDMTSMHDWALGKLSGIRARQELKAAKLKRVNLTEKFTTLKETLAFKGAATRDAIIEKLQILGSSDPDAAQVFCRKLEEVSEDDWEDLETELMMLDLDEFEEN